MKTKNRINWLIDEYKLEYTASKAYFAIEVKSNFKGRLFEIERILINLFEVDICRCKESNKIEFKDKYGSLLGSMKIDNEEDSK